MAIYYGLNSQNYSSLFTSSFSSSKSASGTSLYNSLGDYGMIQRGSYAKLCKAYYAKDTESSKSESATEKTDTEVAEEAVSMKKKANTLSKMDYTEENKSKITSGVKEFVDSYNDMITSANSSDSAKVSNSAKHLSMYTKANETMLKNVGITIGSDNKLSVNTDTLNKANVSNLKNLFKGSTSFSGRTSAYATSIYTSATSSNTSLYSSSGSISSLNMSSLFNSYL